MVINLEKKILIEIYRQWILDEITITVNNFDLDISNEQLQKMLTNLQKKELLEINQTNHITITLKGRRKFTVVLTGGAYDLIHKGHILTLKEAASLGDFLVVVVARDTTIRSRKREPIHNENDRLFLLNELCVVDVALLGDTIDHLKIVNRVGPDIIAIGSDQHHLEGKLKQQLVSRQLQDIEIVRMKADYEELATTRVIDKIIKRNNL